MSEIQRSTLFAKLDSMAYRAIESASVFCKLRGNPYVELVHWIHQLLQLQDSDLHRILRHFELDSARLARDVTDALDRLPRGSTSVTDISSRVDEAVERAWVYSTLMFGESRVRTSHLLVGILKTPNLRHELLSISIEFQRLRLDTLTEELGRIVAGSPEESGAATTPTDAALPAEGGDEFTSPALGRQEALNRFSSDLTERARRGEIDPIVGRDAEIRQLVDILMRRRQNNPIVIGEAGVGKTAVVEGLALRIASGDIPPPLQGVTLRTLDVGLLQAGASLKGEFESRLRQVIEEVQSSASPVILFIDEAHTLVGAGGAAGTGDAANLLKPALARGTLRTIAATTWKEYKKYFEADAALTRRFQPVQIDEPSEDKAIEMMRGVVGTLERHHKVAILDEALHASVRLSRRYIPARQLPDKSVSLLDTAAARVAINLHASPPEVESCRHRIDSLETERDIVRRERSMGIGAEERELEVEGLLETAREQLAGLEGRWQSEKALVEGILGLRQRLGGASWQVESNPSKEQGEAASPQADSRAGDPVERNELLGRLKGLEAELEQLQGDDPLLQSSVDGDVVATVVAEWTGIPVGRMVRDEAGAVLHLADTLNNRVLGQRHALDAIARRIQTSRAGLENPKKPIGVFLLCGPSGVGKTETGLALAEALYGGEQNIVTLNMSEFQEAHTVSTLKGAPPGYVGYGEGGVLTEAVRRKPYSIVLLDEIEKAHRDVHEVFFQVFDKGAMEDAEGRHIDFRNTILLLTSNVGTERIMSLCEDPAVTPEPDTLARALRKSLLQVFPAALLGRLTVVPFLPLGDETIGAIARLQLDRIVQRVREQRDIQFSYSDEVVDEIVNRCTEVESGARVVEAILANTLLPRISREFLERTMQGQPVTSVHVDLRGGEFNYVFDRLR